MANNIVIAEIKSKRKPELVDLGTKLGLETDQLNKDKLIENIKQHLQKNENKYKDDPQYAQYFSESRRKSRKSVAVNEDPDDDQSSLSSAGTPATQVREKSVDLAHTSPSFSSAKRAAISKADTIHEAAHESVEAVKDHSLDAAHEIESEAKHFIESLSQYAVKTRNCTQQLIHKAQAWSSDSQHLLLAGLLIEFLVVLYSITPIRIHRIDVPEPVQKYTTDHVRVKLPYAKSLLTPPFVNPLKKYFIYSLIVPFIPSVFINFDKRVFSPLTFTLVRLALIAIFNSQAAVESYLPLKVELTLLALLTTFSLVELLSKSRK
ncbi:hypothetical protein E3P99_02866 [Wallemia hederae]|uniref:SAP domain-containing protein n=1 Tax=Wallemia hederae TaxID=1540922 RepID=A0A4T0FHR8_9BASI|nr:hypothetical protein E3P99_02866 [Wallemia hederae]